MKRGLYALEGRDDLVACMLDAYAGHYVLSSMWNRISLQCLLARCFFWMMAGQKWDAIMGEKKEGGRGGKAILYMIYSATFSLTAKRGPLWRYGSNGDLEAAEYEPMVKWVGTSG